MNVNNYLDKAYHGKTLKEVANAPVDALFGLSERHAKLLLEAFKVKTVADLAKLKFVKWAQAICTAAEGEA